MNENYLAIDIGGSGIKWGVIHHSGSILKKDKFTINVNDYEAFYKEIVNLVLESKCKFVAISSPGTINKSEKTIVGTVSVPCIQHGPWVKRLESELNVICSIENDANCATLAEMWLGNARGYQNILNIVIGTGIGSTLVINNQIVRGANLYGAELGYLIKKVDGEFCYESEFTSTKALVDRINKVCPVKNGEEVFQHMNNVLVREAYNHYIEDLAMLFYNAIHMYDPEVVLVGGAIASNEKVIADVRGKYEEIRKVVNMSTIKLNMDTCKFYNDANLIGAVFNSIKENEV